jgi:class 3 adenylate cyclase/tetratricopeptide (TPR) repeat protein
VVEGPSRVCASCGTTNDGAARFCNNCGNRLTPAEAPPASTTTPASAIPGRDVERKVITALFCDVVGSTELAERLDPEDVDRLMSTYHGRARKVIEAHGGVVEKFIGDAVVGVFGAPATHEDDPARAVRAALRIVRDLGESDLSLHVRVGVHTGEALVRVGDDRTPEEGFATGDCLNTAARLQNAAPIDGIAVGDPTYRLTAGEFEWADLGPMSLKGKAQPLQVWQPLEAARPTARPTRDEATPFVGRDAELGALVRAFETAVTTSSQQLVTIVAEPGLGKSRIVRELRRGVDADIPGAVWRQGRCLPYGDGVAFWALGEIVKTHAGILETDDQATLAQKLDAALVEPDVELRAWMRNRLAPLVGLRTDAEPPSQDEAFAAWRRFLESLATDGPAVLVVEDLHWADEAMVAFLLNLAEQPAARPILLVVTARPAIAERHPVWLARASASTVLQLVSLDDTAIAGLIGATLTGAAPALLRTVLERAAGSPLYAEQLAALVRERGLSAADATLEERDIPPTIQALLAARIDALPKELKPTLLDASVIGKVFWSGAVAALEGRDRATVEPALSDLERRELTKSAHPSSMVDEAEYGFWHALLREVAYSFLPRAARLAKHRAAAGWITAKAGDSLGDLSEIVVDHLRRALELADATGAAGELPAIRSDLADALLAAASHARRVEPGRAVGYVRNALELLSEDDPRRGATLAALGRALLDGSEYPEAASTLRAAQAWLGDRGELLASAELAVPLSTSLRMTGEYPAATLVREEARPILEADPGPGLVALLAADATAAGDGDVVISRADAALSLAERLGLPEPPMARIVRGNALLELGDRSGEEETRRGIEAARVSGDLRQSLQGYGQLAWALMYLATARDALAVYDEGVAFARDHGLDDLDLRTNRLDALDFVGAHDDLIEEARDLMARATRRGNAYATVFCDLQVAWVRIIRGEALNDPEGIIEAARSVGLPQTGFVSIAARAAIDRNDPDLARRMIVDALDTLPEGATVYAAVENVTAALAIDNRDLAHRILSRAVPPGPTGRGYLSMLATAIVDEADGEIAAAHAGFAEAETYFVARGWVWNRANALAGAGRCLVAMGQAEAGLEALREARRIVEPLRAAPFISRIDAFIAGGSTPVIGR